MKVGRGKVQYRRSRVDTEGDRERRGQEYRVGQIETDRIHNHQDFVQDKQGEEIIILLMFPLELHRDFLT